MSRIFLKSALLSLTALLVVAPSLGQSPAVELEGYYARSVPRPSERSALPARPCISTTCMLPLPRRNAVDGSARQNTRATYDETDAPSRFVMTAPKENPRWESHR